MLYGLCNATPKHWRKVLRRDNENDSVVSDDSVQPFKNSPPTCRQARAFYVSKSFQKLTSEVRLVETGFTHQTITALYVLLFKLTKNRKLSMFQFKINHHILYTRDKLFKAKITDSDSCHVWIEADRRASVCRMPACSLLLEPLYLLVER